jgi:hypothetical protein
MTSLDFATLIDISSIQESTIYEYFTRLNNGESIATSELFVEQGYLIPPFDRAIQGRAAIAQYLEKEAKGMKFRPESAAIVTSVGTESPLENCSHTQYQIQGKVEINWFTVDVIWLIELTAAKEIISVTIKILTSPQDLIDRKIFLHAQ